MCFSARASFTAGAGLILIGIAAIKKAQTKSLKFFASGPIFFGIQQCLEGLVWITLNNGDNQSLLHKFSIYGFMFFAQLFWPLFLPLSVYFLEPDAFRKKLIKFSIFLGILSVVRMLTLIVHGGIVANNTTHHISYELPSETLLQNALGLSSVLAAIIVVGTYLLAAILPFFVTSVPYLWLIGAIGLISCIGTLIINLYTFTSVWCFFAAVTSFLVYYIVGKLNNWIPHSPYHK